MKKNWELIDLRRVSHFQGEERSISYEKINVDELKYIFSSYFAIIDIMPCQRTICVYNKYKIQHYFLSFPKIRFYLNFNVSTYGEFHKNHSHIFFHINNEFYSAPLLNVTKCGYICLNQYNPPLQTNFENLINYSINSLFYNNFIIEDDRLLDNYSIDDYLSSNNLNEYYAQCQKNKSFLNLKLFNLRGYACSRECPEFMTNLFFNDNFQQEFIICKR